MRELYLRYLEEKKTFEQEHGYPPVLRELSADLQSVLKEKVLPEVLEMGMSDLEIFLKAF